MSWIVWDVRCGGAARESRGSVRAVHWGHEAAPHLLTCGFVTTVSHIHSGTAGYSCAEMISPSRFVGLLEQAALSPG